jgi:hypothetical protein
MMPSVQMMHGAGLDDESPAPAGSPVVFLEIPEPAKESELSMAAQLVKAAEKSAAEPSTIKVRVNSPYRVLHEHVAYIADETLDVPNDKEHKLWVQSGWVSLVKGEK